MGHPWDCKGWENPAMLSRERGWGWVGKGKMLKTPWAGRAIQRVVSLFPSLSTCRSLSWIRCRCWSESWSPQPSHLLLVYPPGQDRVNIIVGLTWSGWPPWDH